MSREPQAPEFHIIMKARRSITKSWLWLSGALLITALCLIKFSSVLTSSFFARTLSFGVFLLILTFGILLLSYIGRLHFTTRNRLELNEEGLFDFASFCELGFVPIEAISNIRFSHLWGQEFLKVDFFKQLNPLNHKHGFRAEVYRLLFGIELWVPVGLFQLSRIDLESQLIHLDQLLQRKRGGAIAGRTGVGNGKSNPIIEKSPLAEVAAVDVNLIVPEIPPPLSQVRPEKAAVLEKISTIKNEVKERGFDVCVANLYLDHIARFPSLSVSGLLPPAVSEVQSSQQGTNYEEVRFKYSGQHFSFGLRRDIGPSDEAILSVGLDDRVHFSLRVRVEIGELQPIDLESFIPGEWQSLIEQLNLTIQELLKTKIEYTAKSGLLTQTGTNIEDLKNRFGIKE